MSGFFSRLILLLATLGTLAWLCQTPDLERLIAFLVSLSTYLGLDIWRTRRLSDHDRSLASDFKTLFPQNGYEMKSIKNHDFAQPFRRDLLNPIYEFIDIWGDVNYEFENKTLEKQRRKLYKSFSDFGSAISYDTYVWHNAVDFQTMDYDKRFERPEKEEIRTKLNELASIAISDYEEFVRVLRRQSSKT